MNLITICIICTKVKRTYYYHSNGLIPLKIPRKKNIDIRESGREIEMLLFGEIVKSLSINQIRYLLNENNFLKGVMEFRKGFKILKSEDLVIHGEFSDFTEVTKIPKFNEFKDSTSISTENQDEMFIIQAEDNDDVLGCL